MGAYVLDATDRVWIANDHGGYLLKRCFVSYFSQNGIEYRDLGCSSEEIARYPYYAAAVASAVSGGAAKRGILICSTGIGMSILANKYPGVRASVCSSPYEAKMTRLHNDSNILCVGGRTVGDMKALDTLEAWLTTEYIGERHEISLSLIREAERTNMTGEVWDPGFSDMR